MWEKDNVHELLRLSMFHCNRGDVCYHRAMMMTACDLAAITKPWEIQLKVSCDPVLVHDNGMVGQ